MKATLLVTVADSFVFEQNVLASVDRELAKGECKIMTFCNATSQASALNEGLRLAETDLVICPHQDVHFAPGWLDAIELLKDTTPKIWGVLGPAGTAYSGEMYGTHSGLGMNGYKHVTAQTLDGSCLILRKSSGLRFDESLDRFHGYDVDICLESWSRGLPCYVINVPMEHRTRWASTAGRGAQDFQNAMRYVANKWHGRGVGSIHTTFGTY